MEESDFMRKGGFLGQAVEDVDEMIARAEEWGDIVANNMTQLTTGMLNAVFQGRRLKDVMKQVGQAIMVQIVNALVQAIIKALILRAIMKSFSFGLFSGGGQVSGSPGQGIGLYGQHGGLVPGFRPIGTDTVPAMLTPGELVVPVGMVGELIRVMNKLSGLAGSPMGSHGQHGGVVVNAPIHGTMIGDSDEMVRQLTDAITDRVERGIASLTATTALEYE
jgi:hypothetical protein